ncbi:MAG: putative metal-binding motif-containing protein [Deltaproteobacteria bacterium]|nr:putative metal-binding motif-containing protein [Deltaproteobacteria bacterium]
MRYLVFFIAAAAVSLVAACSQDAAQGQGAYCDTAEDCMTGLVCRNNTCSLPEDSPCQPACNPDAEACFEGECIVVIDPNDRDRDGSPAAEDCDDADRTIYPGAFEFCDGIDNDCDDEIDEGCPDCVDGETQDCGDSVGECMTGLATCQGGRWQACSAIGPRPEICDGLDNDCDGLVDEVCPCHDGQEQACSTDEGECAPGFQNCVDGAWGECINGVLPSPEICDGLDNDCDGHADDGFGVGTRCVQAGECGPGVFECAGEQGVRCSSGPGGSQDQSLAELCNGLDDDCDAETDEDFAGLGQACDGDDSDLCENGIWTCTADQQAMECANEIAIDLEELCNDLDDDCDGLTDEDFQIGEPCIGLGGCGEGEGRIECAGERNVRCSTNPGGSDFTPHEETCDGVDNDCDGETDEDWPELGMDCDSDDTDECALGFYTCARDGSGAVCENETETNIRELCNGVDDNCNGSIDEGYGVGQECNADADACMGAFVCNAEQVGVVCYEPPNIEEWQADPMCNGLDEDCNGTPDDIDRDHDGVNPCHPIPAWDCCDDPGCPDAASINPTDGTWHDHPFVCSGRTSYDWNCDGWEQPRWPPAIWCFQEGFAYVWGIIPCGGRAEFITFSGLCWPTYSIRTQECK